MARRYSLVEARADGWFEQLGAESPAFAQLCEVVGDLFVAYSVIVGLRITALTVDPREPASSMVEFKVGDDGPEQRLTLAEFRQRLATTLLRGDGGASTSLSDEPGTDELQAFIGYRYVLLAPVFGISLGALLVDGDAVQVEISERGGDGSTETLTLDGLRGRLKQKITDSIRPEPPRSPFAIDLNIIPVAKAALDAGDHEQVAEILGGWPGPLSLLLRTAEGQRLTPEVRASLANALGMLGTAYVHLDRFDWALEVLRLGIQWGQDGGAVAGDLFRRLGEAHVSRGLHGQAIGMLRRALQLGASERDVMPALARCFLEREHRLAALVCLEQASSAGAQAPELSVLKTECLEQLGETWTEYQAFMGR